LTAMEHLQFFAMLKGKSGDEAKQEAKYMLQTFKIDENAMACTLSGGMKRKLCLGMALVGDSKVIF
ncbi:ABC tran domain containing protein, partial [Asbolus verrucosus]